MCADDTILPMNYTHYAIVMRGYAENIRDNPSRRGGIQDAPVMTCPCDQAVTSSGECPRDTSATASGGAAACPIGKCRHMFADNCPNYQVRMEPVLNALNEMLGTTETVERDRERLSQPGNTETVAQRDLNDRLVLAERALCTREGLRDRPWFKHLVTLHVLLLLFCALLHKSAFLSPRLTRSRLQVYAPGFFNNYGTDKFPAITDSLCHTLVEEECIPDWPHVRVEIARTAEAIREATDALRDSSLSFRSSP